MEKSISIGNCSAVLYDQHSPIGVHAGNSSSIRKWIEDQIKEYGKMKVYGWHRLELLLKKETPENQEEIE